MPRHCHHHIWAGPRDCGSGLQPSCLEPFDFVSQGTGWPEPGAAQALAPIIPPKPLSQQGAGSGLVLDFLTRLTGPSRPLSSITSHPGNIGLALGKYLLMAPPTPSFPLAPSLPRFQEAWWPSLPAPLPPWPEGQPLPSPTGQAQSQRQTGSRDYRGSLSGHG